MRAIAPISSLTCRRRRSSAGVGSISHVKQRAPVIASASEAIQKGWIASSLALLAMTRGNNPAKPTLPSYCKQRPLEIRGRRECRALGAPAALRAKIKSTQASHHGHTGDIRHSPRNGFNGFLRGLPGEPGLLPPSQATMRKHCCLLDTSVGVSGRHDFAVRDRCIRLLRLPRPPHLLPHVL